jgi:hypothetical protein
LKIGGYSNANKLTAEIVDGAAGIIGAPNEDIIFRAAAYNGDNDYSYAWDFDGDGQFDDAQGEFASFSWNKPGVNWISLRVTDGSNEIDVFDTIVSVEFGASNPSRPVGETSIKPGVTYTYETSVNTQGGYWDKVLYKYSWGDGTESDWLESTSASHTWNKKGIYQVKVKALLTHESTGDDDGEDIKETEWSNPLSISLSRESKSPGPIIRLLQYILEKYPNAFPIIRHILGL